jgi:hypothetical protein
VLAVLTYFYVKETRRLVRAQTSPCVILYVTHDESRRSLLQIVVKNIGAAMAYDVRFHLSRSVPHRAFGMDEKEAETAPLMDRGPLIDGIPALARARSPTGGRRCL